MNPIAEEIESYIGSSSMSGKDFLEHYGMPRRSGRYPWGSGKDPYQSGRDFLGRVEEMRKSGFTYTDENGKKWTGDPAIAKSLGYSTTDFRTVYAIAKDERRSDMVATARRLKEKEGMNNSEIGRKMGINESSVRSLLDPNSESKMKQARETAEFLKKQVDKKKMVDVGAGVERDLNISKEKLDQALFMLQAEGGYEVYGNRFPQATNRNQMTTQRVLCVPGTTHSDIYNFDKIQTVKDYISRDDGQTFEKKFHYPESLDSKRLAIRYKEDGGIDKDGVVELRRNVPDLSLGESRYSQVRIMVDGKKYIKGMAVYKDDSNFPPGANGTNGQTTYFHLKYSNDGGKTFTSNNGEDVGDYFGTYTDFVKEDSDSVEDYTWVKIKGDDGKDGISPTVSVTKKDGKTTITIVDENGTHTQEVLDGTNGTPGTNGVNGKTTYFHVKYSNDGGKTFTSNSGETVGAYIGTCTDYNAADPTSVGSYIWAKIKGDDGRDGTNGTNGKDGKGISKIQTFYQANNSTYGIYTYTSGWSETFTAPSSNSRYLWTYQKTTYTDGSTETTTPHIIGSYGKDGSNLSSAEIWALLLQQNTDFMYKGSDGKIYLKASYIDSGIFCGWTADRINGKLYANASDFDSDSDSNATDGLITPSAEYYTELNAKKGIIKTRIDNLFAEAGKSRNYAALSGNNIYANTVYSYNYANNAYFKKKLTAAAAVQFKGISSGSGTDLVLTAATMNGGCFVVKKSGSSKRFKIHNSFMGEQDVEKLYNLRPVYFKYKPGYLREGDQDCERIIPGFYAELVEKYFPEAVRYDEKKRVADWDPKKLVPAMLKLIQLQKEQLDRQEERLSKIESILNIKEE